MKDLNERKHISVTELVACTASVPWKNKDVIIVILLHFLFVNAFEFNLFSRDYLLNYVDSKKKKKKKLKLKDTILNIQP